MSYWPYGTTADIGICVFASSPESLISQAVEGMQAILLSEEGNAAIKKLPWHHSTWNLYSSSQWDRDLVRVLEEVLFRCEVHEEWIVDLQIVKVESSDNNPPHLACQVAWVDAIDIEREVEIKAVTRHDLRFIELKPGEECVSQYPEVPVVQGPGWVADVVFDI